MMTPPSDALEKISKAKICDLKSSRGCSLYYEISGPLRSDSKGENERFVFMIPGSAADLRRKTDQQYVNLSSGYVKLLTYDHRNTGQSSRADEPLTMEDYADDAAALLQAVVPEKLPCYIVGVSFGGMVAQHLALRHPQLVKKLILCCCATGGEGGSPYPLHEWYKDGVTCADRAVKKILHANSDRTEQWQQEHPTEFQMLKDLVTSDERVAYSDPLRQAGIARQMEARKEHNTWDSISRLSNMDVLCCGSFKDRINPPELVEALAQRIGCECKVDFDWGHPFVAADPDVFAYFNEWLRRHDLDGPSVRIDPASPPMTASVSPSKLPLETEVGRAGEVLDVPGTFVSVPSVQWRGDVWEVVGGGDKGGILVRTGIGVKSPEAPTRLAYGSLVRGLELQGDRLRYELLTGSGPTDGWVSVRLKDKDLLIRTERRPSTFFTADV